MHFQSTATALVHDDSRVSVTSQIVHGGTSMSRDGEKLYTLPLESVTVVVVGFHKVLCAVRHLVRSLPEKHKFLVVVQDTSLWAHGTGCVGVDLS